MYHPATLSMQLPLPSMKDIQDTMIYHWQTLLFVSNFEQYEPFMFTPKVGDTLSYCSRQRSSLYSGNFGPWQFFTGTVVKAFRLNNVYNNVLGVSTK